MNKWSILYKDGDVLTGVTDELQIWPHETTVYLRVTKDDELYWMNPELSGCLDEKYYKKSLHILTSDGKLYSTFFSAIGYLISYITNNTGNALGVPGNSHSKDLPLIKDITHILDERGYVVHKLTDKYTIKIPDDFVVIGNAVKAEAVPFVVFGQTNDNSNPEDPAAIALRNLFKA